ncbi:hypothetical protein Tco_0672679 [Tanacetum coccineum]
MPTEMELTLEQTQQGVSYEVSVFTMKMEILLEPTSNKLMVEHAEYDESNTYVLERFNTTAGNPVKKILLKLNLSDHRLFKDGGGAISERLEIDVNSGFMVTYNSDNDIVEIEDNYQLREIDNMQMPGFPGCGFYQNYPSYQQMLGFPRYPMYVPGFPRYPMQDPQSDSANRKKTGFVSASSSDSLPSSSDFLLSSSDSNLRRINFWNMHPLLKTSVLDINSKKGMCYGTSSVVRLHDTFDNKEQIKVALGIEGLEKGFQIRYPRSDPQRVDVKCIVDTLVAMDGNNQILPLSYGVEKSETFRYWDWFLTKLKECIIGKQDNLTIISNGAGFIALAIN